MYFSNRSIYKKNYPFVIICIILSSIYLFCSGTFMVVVDVQTLPIPTSQINNNLPSLIGVCFIFEIKNNISVFFWVIVIVVLDNWWLRVTCIPIFAIVFFYVWFNIFKLRNFLRGKQSVVHNVRLWSKYNWEICFSVAIGSIIIATFNVGFCCYDIFFI